ncbi:MAG: hypothetical protein CSA32_00730 [Desulfobulbus propionicus]|nr:MAG: hypothetical protein CSA32_00730 [Desulfobulbus propionicus]
MKRVCFLFVAIAVSLPNVSFAESSVRYEAPKYRGFGLDWCRTFEHECGPPVAHAYCRSKGHEKALNFTRWNNPGFKTMTIGQNSVCDPQHHRCDSFRFITCLSEQQEFVNPRLHGYPLDWCKTFASECGRPAAHAFCKARGYNKEVSFMKKEHISGETMTIGENSICNPKYHRCDAFISIKCSK